MWIYRYLFNGNPMYTLHNQIGNGSFGCVYRCTLHEGSDVQCAAKVLPVKFASKEDLHQMKAEIDIWSNIKNIYIVSLYKVIQDENKIILFSELMDETLRDRHARMLRLGSKPKLYTIFSSALQVSRAVEYLHDMDIVHRDLKSENIFVKENACKVGDFGLSRKVGTCMTAETGSYRWMAPEVIRHEEYSTPCDVYSLGILLYEMLTLSVPFSKMTPYQVIFAVARDKKRPELPPGLPSEVRDLVVQCWNDEADLRPKITELTVRLEVLMVKKISFGALEMCSSPTIDHSRFAI
jgi:serine/threonine protein kinase